MGKLKNAYEIFVGKLKEKRPDGRPMGRLKDNIRMDLREVAGDVWTEYIWLRIEPVVGPCEHCNEPSDSRKGKEFLDQLNNYLFSRSTLLHGVSQSVS
jgi:hypothetical protein